MRPIAILLRPKPRTEEPLAPPLPVLHEYSIHVMVQEFAIVLPETNLEGARALAEGLREKVESSRFVFQNELIKVTVSIGCAMLAEDDKSALDLIKRADEKLYEAKRGGRNRVL